MSYISTLLLLSKSPSLSAFCSTLQPDFDFATLLPYCHVLVLWTFHLPTRASRLIPASQWCSYKESLSLTSLQDWPPVNHSLPSDTCTPQTSPFACLAKVVPFFLSPPCPPFSDYFVLFWCLLLTDTPAGGISGSPAITCVAAGGNSYFYIFNAYSVSGT